MTLANGINNFFMMLRKYFIILLYLFSMTVVQANTQATVIYKYIDAQGVLHLTNKPPKKSDELLYSRSYLVHPPPILPPRLLPQPADSTQPYARLIESTAIDQQLPPALLHAVIKVESAYQPDAVSPKGAVGLMQLMPATAARYQVTDRTDPAANIQGGARYLRDLLTLFDNNLSLALAAYNAGEHAVKRHGNQIPPYSETQQYVNKVMALYHRYTSEPLTSFP